MASVAQKPAKTICPADWRAKPVRSALARVHCDEFGHPLVVTSSDHRFLVEKQMRDCGCSGTILLEPEGKNTAPAIFAASHFVMKHIGDALVLVMPSDHHIPDQSAFVEMALAVRLAADGGAIVTFGVAPDRPDTGYGYIELGQPCAGVGFAVKKFHEKPNKAIAKKMLDAENHVECWDLSVSCFSNACTCQKSCT